MFCGIKVDALTGIGTDSKTYRGRVAGWPHQPDGTR